MALVLSIGPSWGTTIAWDGKVLAGDSQVTQGETKSFSPKIVRINADIIGCAGTCKDIEKFYQWYGNRSRPKPHLSSMDALVVVKGQCYYYDEDLERISVCAPYAIGSGKEAALGAMKAGASSQKAVEIAREIDLYTGGPVTYMGTEKKRK